MNSSLSHTDSTLMAALIQGDAIAFERIYFKYVRGLTAYARKRITNAEDCYELVQDIFESLWSRRESLGHVTELEPYLFRTIKYKVIRYYQHNQVVQKYVDHFKAFETMVEEMETEDEISDLRAVIETTLKELPERCQQAVRLRLDENLSNGDIAARMNVDKSTVKRYITTALSHLKEKHSPSLKSSMN
jgi:RNA polymerase sigma-70 factor (family 1)